MKTFTILTVAIVPLFVPIPVSYAQSNVSSNHRIELIKELV